MSETFSGVVEIKNSASGALSIALDGDNRHIKVHGGTVEAGAGLFTSLILKSDPDKQSLMVGPTLVGSPGAMMSLGLKNYPGHMFLFGPSDISITLDGAKADLIAGGGGQAGSRILRDGAGHNTINLDGSTADLYAGGAGQAGSLILRNGAGHNTINLDGSAAHLYAGGAGQPGKLILRNGAGADTITVDGTSGDVVILNADCAEDFDVECGCAAEPGTVMVLSEDGKLRPSDVPFDKRVVGVVSGAGDLSPGIILGRTGGCEDKATIALVGKVYCKVDAEQQPIEPGDLLTTSMTPGHAMSVANPGRAFGTVIGKALRGLDHGFGLIPIVVALQ
jgi:hypothetical protein